jgi:mono/diheme cytochrome c family protein
MTRCSSEILAATSALVCALTLAPPAQAESRGELLYSTHCLACHTSQMHWRDKKQATDWKSLKAQVRQWQATAMLGWSEDDIVGVTRYLNESFYGFSQTQAGTPTPAKLCSAGLS